MTGVDSAPRSLTQMLREFDNASMRSLLIARPDLATPEPTTFSQVASRATTRDSVRAALDSLNAVELWVAASVARAPGAVSAADIADLEPDVANRALDRLRCIGLLWGGGDALRPVRALASELPHSSDTPPSPSPPDFAGKPHQDPERVDSVAAGSAFEFVRRIEVLVEHTDHTPLQLRQDGGLAQREIRVVASLLDLAAAVATAHVQIAQAAGLIGSLPLARADSLLPTLDWDTWRGRELTDQWTWLAAGWRDAHTPSGSPALKALALAAFGRPGDGRVLEVADLQRWLAWQRPRKASDWGRRAENLLAQAGWLGIIGLGAVSSFGTLEDLSALDAHLPARVDSVLLQNDLTAIAPGPLTVYAAKELGAFADVESRGGATVYRFTLESLRRASAAGWTSEQIKAALEQRSRTPIPQSLSYLIADLDRSRAVAATAGQRTFARPPVARHPTLRAPSSNQTSSQTTAAITIDRMDAIVHTLRRASGDGDSEAADPAGGAVAAEGMADSPLVTLREAVETGELVWLGYVDGTGVAGERLVYVSSVEDGLVVATVSRTDEAVTLPIRRITAAHIIRGHSL